MGAAGDAVGHAFVTGGGGFLAGHLTRALAERGDRVTLFVHRPLSAPTRRALPKNVRLVRGDLLRGPLPPVPTSAEVVYHLAGRVSSPGSERDPAGYFDVNATGTVRLLQAVRARAPRIRRVVLPSTALVYALPAGRRTPEDHPVAPRNPYAASKLAAEACALAYDSLYGVPSTVVRLFNVYGPGQGREFVVPAILGQCLEGRALKIGNPWPVRDFLFVEDAVRLLVEAAESPAARGEILNAGSGRGTSVAHLARLASKVTGAGLKAKVDRARARRQDVDRLVADISKARRVLRWTPRVSLGHGLARTAASRGR